MQNFRNTDIHHISKPGTLHMIPHGRHLLDEFTEAPSTGVCKVFYLESVVFKTLTNIYFHLQQTVPSYEQL